MGEHRKSIGDNDLRRIVERVRRGTPRPSATDTGSDAGYSSIADGRWQNCRTDWQRLIDAIAVANSCNLQSAICNRPMIPLRDVIPSRTTPFVTVSLIALNALAWFFELTLPADALPGLPARLRRRARGSSACRPSSARCSCTAAGRTSSATCGTCGSSATTSKTAWGTDASSSSTCCAAWSPRSGTSR